MFYVLFDKIFLTVKNRASSAKVHLDFFYLVIFPEAELRPIQIFICFEAINAPNDFIEFKLWQVRPDHHCLSVGCCWLHPVLLHQASPNILLTVFHVRATSIFARAHCTFVARVDSSQLFGADTRRIFRLDHLAFLEARGRDSPEPCARVLRCLFPN